MTCNHKTHTSLGIFFYIFYIHTSENNSCTSKSLWCACEEISRYTGSHIESYLSPTICMCIRSKLTATTDHRVWQYMRQACVTICVTNMSDSMCENSYRCNKRAPLPSSQTICACVPGSRTVDLLNGSCCRQHWLLLLSWNFSDYQLLQLWFLIMVMEMVGWI